MSIENKGIHLDYLLKVKEGRIAQGLGIGCSLDNYLRFKPKQLTIILGHDNVGKTYFTTWYFLNLALQHNLKWCIWSGENSSGQIIRDMIQILSGKHFRHLEISEIHRYSSIIDSHFDFIDNSNTYKPKDLLAIFEASDCNSALIDPFTGLDREISYESNYKFLNECRHFCNRTGKSIYINTHPVTGSGRVGNIYQQGHMWAGHLKAPLKDDIEGGKAYLNRCDDMIVVHRLTKHDTMRYYTLVTIEKVKDVETGGRNTLLDEPILFDFNRGLGFINDGIDTLKKVRERINKPNEIWDNQ
jgi:hypothetical protein